MQLYRAWHYRSSKSWPCMFIHNPYWIIKRANMGFVEFIFTSLIYISWHSPCWELSRLGEPKCLHEGKLSRLQRLSYLPKSDNSSTRDNSGTFMKTVVPSFQRHSEKLIHPGYLRWLPYKWRLMLAAWQRNIFIIYDSFPFTLLIVKQGRWHFSEEEQDFNHSLLRPFLLSFTGNFFWW